jgi:hypothetical protein
MVPTASARSADVDQSAPSRDQANREYLAFAVQTGGTEVRPHLLRAVRSNDLAEKAIAFLKHTLGLVWRSKSRQYKQGNCNKGRNGDRCDDFGHLVPSSGSQRGSRVYCSGFSLNLHASISSREQIMRRWLYRRRCRALWQHGPCVRGKLSVVSTLLSPALQTLPNSLRATQMHAPAVLAGRADPAR